MDFDGQAPSENQESLTLSLFKEELIGSMDEGSGFKEFLTTISLSELDSLINQNQNPRTINKGVLFENIFLCHKEREIRNTKQAVLQSVFKRIFSSGYATIDLEFKKNPDYLEINDQGMVVEIYECKTSQRFMQRRSREQREVFMKTIGEIVSLTKDPSKAPTSIGPLISMLISVNKGPLLINQEIALTYVLPQNLKDEARESNLRDKGLKYQYMPVTTTELLSFIEMSKKYFK